MERLPRNTALLLFALGLMTSVCADSGASSAAERLISVMRLDFAVLDAVQWRSRMSFEPGGASDRHNECMMKQDATRFKPALTETIESALTQEEVQFALAFYLTPAGRKFTEASIVDVRSRADPSIKAVYPEVTERELAEISQFNQSKVADKLRGLPIVQGVERVAVQMVTECSSARQR